MTPSPKYSPNFKVEGLEARILLSGVPLDGDIQNSEEPMFADSVLVVESGVTESAEVNESPQEELYTDAVPLNSANEVFLSGQLEAGLLVEADVIHIADGTILENVQLSAGSILIGAAEWVGENTVLADAISILEAQSASEGASLVLAPRGVEAAIALGFDDNGFSLNGEEMSALAAAGLESLVIGLGNGAHDVTIDGLAYEGNLQLRSPETGGEFYILSPIHHSGGVLSYEGSGQTQNASADTITSGNEILIDDSLNLVYVEGSGNTFGDNTFYFDTTNGSVNPGGGDILISGDILGTGVDGGGTLYLNAGTTGDILIQGGVGTLEELGRIVIVNAHNVTFEGNIILDSFEQKAGTGSTTFGATASNSVLISGAQTIIEGEVVLGDFKVKTANNVTFGGDFESAFRNTEITVDAFSASGKVWFKGDVNIDNGDLIIHEANDFEIVGSAEIAGALLQTIGNSETIFRASIQANTIDLFAQQRIRFLNTVTLLEGDMVLVSDEIDFEGGAGSVIGALDSSGNGLSSLYLRPTTAAISMDIGNPTGGTGTFVLSNVDIAALADGFALITLGYHQEATTSTNAVRIGNASFLDALEIYGGSFLINGSFNARTSLLVDADSGLISITGTQVRVSNEQVDNVWQSSVINLLAHTGNIQFANGASLLIDNEDPDNSDEGSTIHLTATVGSIINQANSFGFVEARDLNAVAGQAITLLTDVDTVTALSTGVGNIQIDELDGLHVLSGITTNGAIALSTGGDTVIDLLESKTDASANTIGVEVFAGDLHIDKLLAGTQGSVEIEVEGALTGFSQTDRSALLDLPRIELSGGDNGAQAASTLALQGVTIALNTTLFTDSLNGSIFRLVASEEPALTPVRIVSGDGVYTIYALPGTATHADVVAALDALGDFDAAITSGSSSVLALPAITLAGGTAAPLAAATGTYDFGSTVLRVSALTAGEEANGTRVIFAADADGVPSAEWDDSAGVLTLHYVSGVTSVGVLRNLINGTTAADLSASLISGTGTQILGIETTTVISGANPSTASGEFDFGDGVLTVSGATPGSSLNGIEVYFVGDAAAGTSSDWDAGASVLTINFTAGVSTLGDLAAAVNGASGVDVLAAVSSGNSFAVLGISMAELNGGSAGVPAAGNLTVDGVNLRITDTTETVTDSGPTFRLVGALVDSSDVALTEAESVRILSVGDDYTIYALAGTATHADVLSAINALNDFSASIVDAHIVGDVLTLNTLTGIGEALNPLQISANKVDATNANTGVVNLQQDDNRASVDVSIDNQSVVAGDYVAFVVLGGNTTVSSNGVQSASDAGVLLDLAGSVTIDGDFNSQGGPLTFLAVDLIQISDGVSLESNGGDVFFTTLDDLTMAADASVLTDGGVLSANVGGDLQLGILNASVEGSADRTTWGDIALQAAGFILDYSASASVNVLARSLQLNAGTTIGQIPNGANERAIELNVVTLAAESNTGVIVLQSVADLSVGEVASFTPSVLTAEGSIVDGSEIAALTGLLNNGGGDILIASAAGLTATDSIVTTGTGRIVLIGNSLTIEDAVTSSGGSLTLSATNALVLGADADVDTIGSGEILLISDNATALAAAGSAVTAVDGAILISAAGNITLGTVSTGGALGLDSTSGSILAASGGNSARVVLSADTLAVVAGGSVAGVNGTTDALSIDVNTISVFGGSGAVYNLSNDGSLLVDTTAASVTRFSSSLVGTSVLIAAQSNLSVSGEGSITVAVTNGGDFDLAATRKIDTTGAGAISLQIDGALTMGTGAHIFNENGAIVLNAGNTISVAQVSSEQGNIAATSTAGSIIDVDPTEAAVDFETSGQLTLNASTGVGIETGDRQTLTVTLGTLAASTATGGIFVSSTESFATNGLVSTASGTVSVLSVGTLTVGPNGSGVAIDSAADLVLLAGGALTQLADSTIEATDDVTLYGATGIMLFSVSTTGNVALESDGAVMGYADPTFAAITAQGLLLDEVSSLGTPAQRVSLDVSVLAGTVQVGTLAFDNAQSLTLDTVSVSTTAIAPTGGALPTVPRVQTADTLVINSIFVDSDLSGEGFFVTIDGNLTASSGGLVAAVAVTQALPVLVQTTGAQIWNGSLDIAGGDSTLRASGAIEIAATGSFASSGGDLSVETDSNFVLTSGATMDLDSGALLVNSDSSITIEGQVVTTGAVALIADDSILAGVSGGAIRVTASDLLLRANFGIGSSASVLTAQVAQISASAGAAGIYLSNTGAVRVTNLGFAVTSFAPDSTTNVAFSGFQGGIQTQLSGAIQFDNDGTVVVDPIKSVIKAFPGSDFEIALLMDEAGPAGNAASVLFEIIREDGDTIDASEDSNTPDLRDGNPPSTYFNETSSVLRVFVRNDVTTVAEIIDAINADPDFAGSAVLVTGPSDGSTVFSLGVSEENGFFAEDGADEGIVVYNAGITAVGADPIAAYAEIQPGDALYTIRVTSTNPGAAANDFVFRLLDDGPGGNLTDATDSALVVWNASEGLLVVYINYGYTTAGEIVDAINLAEAEVDGAPFTAEFTGVFDPADENDLIGDASVLMISNLSAQATIRAVGTNNDFKVTSNIPGPLYNGISFRFVDDGLVATDGVRASFDDVANVMTVYINSAVTTANQVIAALNDEGTFTATLTPELSTANNGTGAIQATRYWMRNGAVSVNASVTLALVGTNNDLIITADEPGDNQNAVRVVLVSDVSVTPGAATASYDDVSKILEIRINPDFATPGGILTAINLGPNADSIPFSASLPEGTTGFGGIQLVTHPVTAGGTGSISRAVVNAYGDNNGFEVVADSDSTLLQNIRVNLIDNGSISNGSAVASYINASRSLILNVQTGVTTANTLIAAINASAVPVSASLSGAANGTGTFGNPAQAFINGADPIVATLTTELPRGISVQLDSTVGGIVNNGIQVSYAIDASLATGTASANLFETEGLRLLQIRFADATTTIGALQDYLEANTELGFTVANIGAIESEFVGDLSDVAIDGNEGAINMSATSSISLFARVTSQTGAVSISTTNSGDFSFDSATARVSAIDGIDLDLDGAFINNASLESPLLKVYDTSLLRIDTGNVANSTESIRLETNGSVEIDGAGLNLDEADFYVDAAETVWVNAAITATGATTIDVGAGDTFTLTASGSLLAETISLLSGNEAVFSGTADSDTFTLTADAEIRQSGTIETVDALSVTSESGAILMSGAASSSSETGEIAYSASLAIEVTSIQSSDGGDISLTSGASLTNSLGAPGTNVATTGDVTLSAVSGVGEIGDPIRVESGTLSLSNSGASGDIVATETTAGDDLVITSATQAATVGRTVLISENGAVHFTGLVSQAGSGSFLVESAGSVITDAAATVTLGGGALTLSAVSDVTLNANLSSGGGDVSIDAGAALTMASTITLSAGGGDVALLADGDIEVAQVLSLLAGVYIASANGSVHRSSNDGRTNVKASNLQVIAGTAIGSLASTADALVIEVDRLTATAENGVLAFDSMNDLTIGETTVSVDYAQVDGTTDSDVWTSYQLRTNAGNAVLRGRGALTFDSIAVNPTIQINGNVLISAADTFQLDGATSVSGGSAQLTSVDAFTLNADFTLTDTGTVLIEAGGDFVQADTSTILTSNQDAIISSTGAMSISSINAGFGDLALTSGGALTRLTTAPATQIISSALRLSSGDTIASVADPLVVDVTTLSAAAVGSIRLSSIGDVEVDSVSVTVDRVSTIGVTSVATARTAVAQSDISSSVGGDVLLQFGGHLILQDGIKDERAIGTNGDGRIFVGAASLEAYAAIRSLDGDITVDIDGEAHWISVAESAPAAGDATTSSVRAQTGDIFITTGDDIVMDERAFIRSTSGNIAIDVTGSFTVGSVEAASGYVNIQTTAAILDGGDATVDIIADRLQIATGTGAGLLGATTYNPLEISVNRLSAQMTTGPLALAESNDLQIGLTEGTVSKLDIDGVASVALDANDALFGIDSLGGGSVTIVASGTITTMAALAETPELATIRISNTGDLLLHANAAAASVAVNGDIEASGGSITLRGTAGVSLASDVTVNTDLSGTLTVLSSAGGLTMGTGSTLSAPLGDIVVNASGLITVAGIQTAGKVALTSTTNSITDNEAARTNVTASTLRLNANGTLGSSTNAFDTSVTKLSARATTGSMYLLEVDGLQVGATQATSSIVAANGVTTATLVAEQSGVATLGSNGAVIITLSAGDLAVLSGHTVSAANTGRIRLDTPGQLSLLADVFSGQGSITLLSTGNLALASGVEVTTGGAGQIHLTTGGNLLSLADSRFVASTGNVVLNANGNLTLGGVSTQGRAALTSLIGEIRAAGSTAFDQEVIASYLLLSAANTTNGGVGSLAPSTLESFRTQVGRVAAIAGAGGIHLVNSAGVTVGSVQVSTSRVTVSGGLENLTDLSLSDLATLSGSASIVLRATSGSITLNEGGDLNGASVVAHGAGNVLLSAANNLTANASVLSTSGHLTVKAVNLLRLVGGSTIGTGTSGTIIVQSTSGALTMEATAIVRATGSSALLDAIGTITLGVVEASSVDVVSDAGSIVRATGSATNLTATDLRLFADTGIASASTPLQINAGTLAANTRAGGIFLLENDDADVGADISVTVFEVNNDSSLGELVGDSSSGLSTTVDGSIVLITLGGSFEIKAGAPVIAGASGLIRIDAATGLSVNSNISSSSGAITLITGEGMLFGADTTVSTGGSADVYIDAGEGLLLQTASTTISAGANVRLAALGNITLGSVSGVGISVLSGGHILAATGSTNNFTASKLRLNAASGIGQSDRYITTAVAELSARTGNGSIYITDIDSVTITSVAVTTNRVSSTATLASQTDAAQADLRSGGNGNIVLTSQSADIFLNDGNSDGSVVVADGAGSILLVASRNMSINSGVFSGSGNITLGAGINLSLGATSVTTSAGDVAMVSISGTITMPATARVSTATGNLRVTGVGDLTVGQLSGAGVSILSEFGSLISAQFSTINVTADSLRVSVDNSIGTSGRHLLTEVDTLTTSSRNGATFITENSSVSVTSVRIETDYFNTDAGLTPVIDAAQSDMTAGGVVVLVVKSGDLTLDDGNASIVQTLGDGRVANTVAVQAGGSGGLLLSALDGAIIANASIRATTGHLTVRASDDISINGSSVVQTTSSGHLSVASEQGTLTFAPNTSAVGAASVRLASLGDLTVGAVTGGIVSLKSTSGALLNDAGSQTRIIANSGLRLAAFGSIGLASNHLRINTAVLSARSTEGSLYLSDSSSTTVSSVRVTTTEFTATAGSVVRVDAAQSDLVTLDNGDIVLVLTTGDLTLNDGNAVVNQSDGDNRSANASAVIANGTGRIYLEAAGFLTANANILSTTGLITITASGLLTLSDGVDIISGADISIRSALGSILMAGTVDVEATNSVLRLAAANAVSLGNLTASDVSLVSGAAVVNAVGSTLNVSADSLRISALGAIGTANRHITVDVVTLTGYADESGLFITAQNTVTVTAITTEVVEMTSNAVTTTETDSMLNGLTALNDGSIVLKTLSGSIGVPNVTSIGSGSVLLSAADGLLLTGSLNSGTGSVTLQAANTITFGLGASLVSATEDSILIESDSGSFTMAGNATIAASDATIAIHADGNITLGTTTGNIVSLVSSNGGIRRAATVITAISADHLRIDASGSVGTLERLLTANIDLLSIAGASVHLSLLSNTTVGTVAVALDRLLSDLSTEAVEDAALSGVVTTTGGLIDINTVSGDLSLSASEGILSTGGAGNVLLNVDGDFNAGANITSGSGTITLNIIGSSALDADLSSAGNITVSSGGAWSMTGPSNISGAIVSIGSDSNIILGNISGSIVAIDSGAMVQSAAGSTRNITAATEAAISSTNGIGSSGSNFTLTIESPVLSVENLTSGSAYLQLVGTSEINQLDLNNAGSLYLDLTGGDLDLSGGIALGTGSIVVRVNGALELGSAVTAEGDIQLTVESLIVAAGLSLVDLLIESLERSIELRVSGELSLPAGAILSAELGNIKLRVGGDVSLPVVIAGGLISVRGSSHISAAGIGNENHLLSAETIQLLAGASLGATEQPIVTLTSQLDAQASGTADVVELDDLKVGRFGLRLKDAGSEDTFVLLLDNATAASLSSVNGAVNVDGNFILQSSGLVTLQTRLINTDGNIFLDVGGIQFALEGAETVFVAGNGLLNIEVGAAGIGEGLSLTAAQLTALVASGNFTALINGSTEVTADGIVLTDTTGSVNLTVENGNLTLGGAVIGQGGIRLEILNGGLTTTDTIGDISALVAGNEGIELELGSGASGAGGNAIVTESIEFSALTGSGDLNFEFRPSGSNVVTNLVNQGLTIRSGGTGNITLLVSAHNLNVLGNIEHAGFGSISVNVDSGGLEMLTGSSILVNNGTLNLSARNFLVVNYIENLVGATFIDSALGLIVRNTAPGTSAINFSGSIGPVITLNNSINLLLDTDSATINDILIERQQGDEFLFVSGTFQ